MKTKLWKPRALSAALAAAFALPVLAEEAAGESPAVVLPWAGEDAVRALKEVSSHVEVGALHVSGSNTYEGSNFTGLDAGNYAIFNASVKKRRDDGGFFNLDTRNLGLDSRQAAAEVGVQGDFRVGVEYTRIPRRITEEAMTVFSGVDGNHLKLPTPWTAGTGLTDAAMRNSVNANLKTFELGWDRERTTISGEKLFGAWEISSSLRHETVNGTKLTGGILNLRSTLLPEPIDYTTDEFTLNAAYNGERVQVEVGYLGSLFSNEFSNLNWRNPFNYAGGAAFNNAIYDPNNPAKGVGALGVMPDNQMHQISAQVAARLTDTTRATAAVVYKRMTQDEDFQPYTANQLLRGSATNPGVPLPRQSLDGQVDATVVTLGLNMRPLPKLTLNANYRYDDHDNKTPQDTYRYVQGDRQDQELAKVTNSPTIRTSLPYSWTTKTAKLDAAYRFTSTTRLLGGYEWTEKKRDYSDIDKEKEDTYKLELSAAPLDILQASITAAQSARRASNFDTAAAFNASYTPQFSAAIGGYDNLPALRKFYLANRDRTKVRAFATLTPHRAVAITLAASRADDDYTDSPVGLSSAIVDSYTADIAYTPTEAISASAWYSREDYESRQTGRSLSLIVASKPAQSVDPARNWTINADDVADTFGISLKGRVTRNIELAADYVQSWTRSSYDASVASSSAGTVGPFAEDPVTRYTTLNLSASYKYRPDTTLRLIYTEQNITYNDWAWDKVMPTTIANVLTTGQGTPDSTVRGIGVSLDYRFH